MPASRSAKPPTSSAPATTAPAAERQPRYILLLVVLIVATGLAIAVIVLPASLITRALPPGIHAEDLSGSVWHGSAGRLNVNGRDAGAVEWRLRPVSMLRMKLVADVRWVKIGFVAEGLIETDQHTITASELHGSGALGDLQELGLAGWRGDLRFAFKELQLAITGDSVSPLRAVGSVAAADLSSAQFADGTNIGGYELTMADGAITPDTDATGELKDTGGPLQVNAVIHYSAAEHTAMLSGTIKERGTLPPALQRQIDNISQLHARDARGQIPFELEFTL